MLPRRAHGWSSVETVVTIVVLGGLAFLALPAFPARGCCGSPMTQTLSNMRQLHLATQCLAIDGTTTGQTNFCWPGSGSGRFDDWAALLVKEKYLSQVDLCKLLSAPNRKVPPDSLPVFNDCGILVYAVREESPSETVFLTSANFTNTPAGGAPLQARAKPFGNKGFVVFRKGGDGGILLAKQVGDTNVIGAYAPLCR